MLFCWTTMAALLCHAESFTFDTPKSLKSFSGSPEQPETRPKAKSRVDDVSPKAPSDESSCEKFQREGVENAKNNTTNNNNSNNVSNNNDTNNNSEVAEEKLHVPTIYCKDTSSLIPSTIADIGCEQKSKPCQYEAFQQHQINRITPPYNNSQYYDNHNYYPSTNMSENHCGRNYYEYPAEGNRIINFNGYNHQSYPQNTQVIHHVSSEVQAATPNPIQAATPNNHLQSSCQVYNNGCTPLPGYPMNSDGSPSERYNPPSYDTSMCDQSFLSETSDVGEFFVEKTDKDGDQILAGRGCLPSGIEWTWSYPAKDLLQEVREDENFPIALNAKILNCLMRHQSHALNAFLVSPTLYKKLKQTKYFKIRWCKF